MTVNRTPREVRGATADRKRPGLGRAGNFASRTAGTDGAPDRLAKRGRQFICLDCEMGEVEDKAYPVLKADEVVGDNVSGFFHKGFLGHRVTVVLTKYCTLADCGCDGDAHV